jgi:hypothetical protein
MIEKIPKMTPLKKGSSRRPRRRFAVRIRAEDGALSSFFREVPRLIIGCELVIAGGSYA